MKIVEPSVRLVHHTPHPERIIEQFGRVCYQSQHAIKPCNRCEGRQGLVSECSLCEGTGTDIESANAFVRKIRNNKHLSVLEHVTAGFSVITDRGVTHEIVRHRIGCSYSQESTRYCGYYIHKESFDGDIRFIKPPELNNVMSGIWTEQMQQAEQAYRALICSGASPQIARSVLPNSLKSEIGITLNFTAWMHFLTLRLSPKAHPQMRQIAGMLRDELVNLSPAVFEQFKAENDDQRS